LIVLATHNTANYGVPAYPHYSTCSGNPIVTMNYMDYTDDEECSCFQMVKKAEWDNIPFRRFKS
jgi:hypothetical protein